MAFTITDHAMEKHLYNSHLYENASMFINKQTMMFCVIQCVKMIEKSCKSNVKQTHLTLLWDTPLAASV